MLLFWWKRFGQKVWIRWETICLPKYHGGLGFYDLGMINLAVLAKTIMEVTE